MTRLLNIACIVPLLAVVAVALPLIVVTRKLCETVGYDVDRAEWRRA